MKHLLLLIAIPLTLTAKAQTHYGTSAGTLGSGYSYFGSFAGNAATGSSYENSFFGASAGRQTTTGHGNTAIGLSSLRENTLGYWNTAVGASSLRLNTTGHSNIAIGRVSLYWNTTGYENIALGTRALLKNTDGFGNLAIGTDALNENTIGVNNVAIGTDAMLDNTSGTQNIAIGTYTLQNNISGTSNTAVGFATMVNNTEGRGNVAIGGNALYDNTTGERNSAVGGSSLYAIIGSYNCGFGSEAGAFNYEYCEGSFNSFLGSYSGSTLQVGLTNSSAIGYFARGTASNQVRIGNIAVTSIGGQVAWSNLSDGRFKRDIKSDVAGLDFIKNLKPVSYIVDQDALNKFLGVPDSLRVPTTEVERNTRQVGFVAQEVDALIKKSGFVFSGIESPKNENDLYAIRYGEFVVPLVKAMQELIAEVDHLKEQLSQSKAGSAVAEGNIVGASMYQNNPNPFSNTTEIQMELPETTRQAAIIVYNLEGKELKSITVNDRGKAMAKISANEFGAGMYLYALIVDGKVVDTKRFILTK